MIKLSQSKDEKWIKTGKLQQKIVQNFLGKEKMIMDISYDANVEKPYLYDGKKTEAVALEWEYGNKYEFAKMCSFMQA